MLPLRTACASRPFPPGCCELGATDSAPSFSKGDLGDSEGTVLLVTDGAGDLGVAEAQPVQRIENAERFVTLCLVEVRHALLYRAIDTWLGTGTRDWSSDLRAIYTRMAAQGDSARARMEARRIKDTRPSLPLEQYAGTYVDSLYGKAVVTYENGALRFRASSKQAGTLEHWQYDMFRVQWDAAWRGGPMVAFVLGADGKPAELRMSGGILRRAGN